MKIEKYIVKDENGRFQPYLTAEALHEAGITFAELEAEYWNREFSKWEYDDPESLIDAWLPAIAEDLYQIEEEA